MQPRKAAPARIKIARAWVGSPELPMHLSVLDEKGLYHTCWACSTTQHARRDRAHIQSHSTGGSHDDPLNFLLLCARCHEKQPDTASRALQLRWLASAPSEVEVKMRGIQYVFRVLREQGITKEEMLQAEQEDPEIFKVRPKFAGNHEGNHYANFAWRLVEVLEARRMTQAEGSWASVLDAEETSW